MYDCSIHAWVSGWGTAEGGAHLVGTCMPVCGGRALMRDGSWLQASCNRGWSIAGQQLANNSATSISTAGQQLVAQLVNMQSSLMGCASSLSAMCASHCMHYLMHFGLQIKHNCLSALAV